MHYTEITSIRKFIKYISQLDDTYTVWKGAQENITVLSLDKEFMLEFRKMEGESLIEVTRRSNPIKKGNYTEYQNVSTKKRYISNIGRYDLNKIYTL